MLSQEVIEKYCQVVLHTGCAVTGEKHKWDACPVQEFYRRAARKHQHKLQSNGLAIGIWINEKKYDVVEKQTS